MYVAGIWDALCVLRDAVFKFVLSDFQILTSDL